MKTATPGFTLIEILVVVSIIVILASVGIFSATSALKQADITAEQANIDQLRIALNVYKEATGQYPPSTFGNPVDNCSLCTLRNTGSEAINDAQTQWNEVANVLVPRYMPESIQTDTWGNPYGFDNNFNVGDARYYTVMCSMGPDGVLQTFLPANRPNYEKATVPNPTALGDDICFFTF
jgi:prepilin-type N-terminal cleavage/methylation domain-containing protein